MGARTGPASDPTRLGRRTLLRAGLTAAAAVPLLSACRTRPHYGGALRIPSPQAPIRWPLSKRYPIIDSGLKPKAGSILRIYNYADYLSPRMMKDFEAQWGVDIRLSTFNDADEALTKIAAGEPRLRPLLPELRLGRQADPGRPAAPAQPRLPGQPQEPLGPVRRPLVGQGRSLHDPLHRLQHRASAGAPTSPTSTSRRTTRRGTSSGTPQYRGNMAILDDWHTAIALVLIRNGYDLNTTSAKDLGVVREQLLEPPLDDAAQGHHLDVQRHAGRAVRPGAVLVGRRDQHALLPAEEDRPGHPALLGAPRRSGRGRQRPGRLPRPGRATRWPPTTS